MGSGTYYEILGLSKDASAEDIHNAYAQLIAETEKTLEKGSVQYNNRIGILKSAYQTLSDPNQRASYNKRQVHRKIYQSQPEENLFLSALKDVVFSKKMIFVAVIILVIILSIPDKKPNAQVIKGESPVIDPTGH